VADDDLALVHPSQDVRCCGRGWNIRSIQGLGGWNKGAYPRHVSDYLIAGQGSTINSQRMRSVVSIQGLPLSQARSGNTNLVIVGYPGLSCRQAQEVICGATQARGSYIYIFIPMEGLDDLQRR
jgi:hypothetical protein